MRLFAVAAVLALSAVAAMPVLAEEKTITGEVIDVQCRMKKAENTGAGHENCALSCAKRGAKMGVLTPDGVYVIAGDYTAENNKKLLPFVAKTVTASGDVMEKEGQTVITVAKMEAAPAK
jgi:hypothetical protein